MSYIFTRAEAQGASVSNPAYKTLDDWDQHAQPGDLAQAKLFFTDPTAHVAYGSPIQPGKLFWLERRIISKADFALVRSFNRTLVLLDKRHWQAIVEAAI